MSSMFSGAMQKHFVTWIHKNEHDGSDSFSTELFKYCSNKTDKNCDAIKQRNDLKCPKVIAANKH